MKKASANKWKWLSLSLACVCLLGVAGCGEEGPSGETSDILLASELNWRSAEGRNVFDAEHLSAPFFSDKADAVTYFANAMYMSYGYLTYDNQEFVGMGVGWCPAWYEWIVLTRNWSDNESTKQIWRNYVIDAPMSADGYVWSYDTPHWPDIGYKDSHHNYHYDNNFRYIIAVWNYCAWENSFALLDEVDPSNDSRAESGEGDFHLAEDVTKGMTVGEKFDLAVEYVMTKLHGEDGLIIIDKTVNDGLNLGTTDSYSCNYWDNIPFGYKDAYENMLFYNMLNCLTEMEAKRGNAEQSAKYAALAETVKKKYNETFWNEATGRYVGTVDINGTVRDYGITFLNTEAVTYGLASEEQVKRIYDWLDGRRIVEGDTSTGEDIYEFIAAPRSNTVDYGAVADQNNGSNKYWWHDNNGGQALSGNGIYGYHVENGGAILYTEFYDLMGRIRYLGAQNGYERMLTLAREYAKDELKRDPTNPVSGGRDVLGFIGEFPESGLVPTAYLYGFLGVGLDAAGLKLDPNIPDGYRYMGVQDLVYGGEKYTLTVWRNGRVVVEGEKELALCLTVKDASGKGSATVTLYDAYDNRIGTTTVAAKDGYFVANLKELANGAAYAVIE